MSVHPRRHHAPPCSPDNCRFLPGAEIKALPSPKYALTQLRRRSGAKEPGGAPVQSSARPSPEQPRPSPRAPQTPRVGAFPAPTARGSPRPAAPTPPPQVGRAVSHRAAPAQRSVPRGASSSCCQAPTAVPTTPRPPLPCLQRSAAQRHRRCLPAPSALFSSVLPHFALAAPPARPAQQADSTARATRLSVPGLPERDGAAVPWEAAGEHFCFACPRRGLPRRPRGPGALCPALLCEQPQRCARRRAARRGALRALWDPVCAPYPTRGRTATGTEGELAVLHLPTAPREPCAAFRFHPTMPPPRSQQSAAPQGAQRGEALTRGARRGGSAPSLQTAKVRLDGL